MSFIFIPMLYEALCRMLILRNGHVAVSNLRTKSPIVDWRHTIQNLLSTTGIHIKCHKGSASLTYKMCWFSRLLLKVICHVQNMLVSNLETYLSKNRILTRNKVHVSS